MEGLEISEVKFSELRTPAGKGRIDAEYFSKRFLKSTQYLQESYLHKDILRNLTVKIDVGHVGPMVHAYNSKGIPLLQTQNIMEFFVDYSDCIKISPSFHSTLKKSQVTLGDCLIARSGSIGNTAFVIEGDPQPLNSADIIIVRANPHKITNGFLAGFLNSKYGALQIERLTSGGVQGHINLGAIEHICVPLAGDILQQAIDAKVRLGMLAIRKVKTLFEEAENVISKQLGLEHWKPSHSLTYSRAAPEVFSAGRWDAEFFKEKFIEAKKILVMAGALEFIPFDELIASLTNGHTPLHHDLTKGEIPFLCAEHVSNFECDYDSKKRILVSQHAGELARTSVHDGDLLMTIKGRVGNVALVENIPGPTNINQDVALLRLNDRLPIWWIISFLNSPFGRLQVEQFSTGGINPFLGLSNVRKLSIPRFPDHVMFKISMETRDKVLTARGEKRHGYEFLNVAKRAVEIAIENSEEEALEYLKQIKD